MVRLALIWHMHQPRYLDPSTGRLDLPWVRMHALKDYFGMVHLLRDFPGIQMTFNLVPSLLEQLQAYSSGARDRFQDHFFTPADQLNAAETSFLLRHFFSANPDTLIRPYPRYLSLFEKREQQPGELSPEAGNIFKTDELRDIQMWFSLTHFDETYKHGDPVISGLIEKGRDFTEMDKQLVAEKEDELLARVIPEYQKFLAAGQIEISTTPFYHPILPLLIDPQLGRAANPDLGEYDLEFNWEQDARDQLEAALAYMEGIFGQRPAGIWPSEGSISEAVIALMDDLDIRWTASDEGILAKSLGISPDQASDGSLHRHRGLYQPYRLGKMRPRLFFRDRLLSDLIGFQYQSWRPGDAAADFHRRLSRISRETDRSPVVTVILDGENPWDYYTGNGREFLRELFSRLQGDNTITTVRVQDALDSQPAILPTLAAGSWINANFDIWIGHEEDRRAWRLISDTRAAIAPSWDSMSETRRKQIRELLWTAEGSDWFWWFGKDHYTSELDLFDGLFRANLREIYRLAGLPVPCELDRAVAPRDRSV